MAGRQMNEAPHAVDGTGGYYPVRPLNRSFRKTLAHEGQYVPPLEATHFTWDPDTGQIVDWLREVAAKSSRGLPADDPDGELCPAALSVAEHREKYPDCGLFVRSAYEVIGQAAA